MDICVIVVCDVQEPHVVADLYFCEFFCSGLCLLLFKDLHYLIVIL